MTFCWPMLTAVLISVLEDRWTNSHARDMFSIMQSCPGLWCLPTQSPRLTFATTSTWPLLLTETHWYLLVKRPRVRDGSCYKWFIAGSCYKWSIQVVTTFLSLVVVARCWSLFDACARATVESTMIYNGSSDTNGGFNITWRSRLDYHLDIVV